MSAQGKKYVLHVLPFMSAPPRPKVSIPLRKGGFENYLLEMLDNKKEVAIFAPHLSENADWKFG